MIYPPGVQSLLEVMHGKHYRVFEDGRGYDLNLVGIRTASIEENLFNDWLMLFYRYQDAWTYCAFPCTTDPGTYYRLNPLNVKGTAVLKPGQYRGAYMIGRHRGYKALQQKGPVTVYRDANRDTKLDTEGMEQETGVFAINIHRANAYRTSTEVGKWSAGCQVLQDPTHFAMLLQLCDKAAEIHGNSFSYTLLEERDFS